LGKEIKKICKRITNNFFEKGDKGKKNNKLLSDLKILKTNNV
jgi:hypothetical protein